MINLIRSKKFQRWLLIFASLFMSIGTLGGFIVISLIFNIDFSLDTTILGPIMVKHIPAVILGLAGIQLARGKLI